MAKGTGGSQAGAPSLSVSEACDSVEGGMEPRNRSHFSPALIGQSHRGTRPKITPMLSYRLGSHSPLK